MASPVPLYLTSKVAGLAWISRSLDTNAMISYRQRYLLRMTFSALVVGAAMFAGADERPDPETETTRVIAIVTHVENEVDSITRSELARIFLKQQSTWSDGERCIPIDQRGDSAIRKEFSRLVLQRTVHEMKRYWMRETMTGNAKPPVSLESATTVKKYLQKITGAVAYIYLDEVDDTVRILAVRDLEALALPSPEDGAGKDPAATVGPSDGDTAEGEASPP